MAYPSANAAGGGIGVRGIYRVVVRAAGRPEDDARTLARLLDLPDPPVYENPVAGARGAAVVLPSGSELLTVEPLGDDGLLTGRVEESVSGGLVLVILEVHDVDAAVGLLRERGAEVGDPVATGRGRRMALIDPGSTAGVALALIELPPIPE